MIWMDDAFLAQVQVSIFKIILESTYMCVHM